MLEILRHLNISIITHWILIYFLNYIICHGSRNLSRFLHRRTHLLLLASDDKLLSEIDILRWNGLSILNWFFTDVYKHIISDRVVGDHIVFYREPHLRNFSNDGCCLHLPTFVIFQVNISDEHALGLIVKLEQDINL